MDIFLYQGATNQNDVILTDPTVSKLGVFCLIPAARLVYAPHVPRGQMKANVPIAAIVYTGYAPPQKFSVRVPEAAITYWTNLLPMFSGAEPVRARFRLNVTNRHASLKFENDFVTEGFELLELRFLQNPISEARPDVIPLNITDVHASLKFENADALYFIRLLYNVIGDIEPNMVPMDVTAAHASVKFENADALHFVDFLIDAKVNW